MLFPLSKKLVLQQLMAREKVEEKSCLFSLFETLMLLFCSNLPKNLLDVVYGKDYRFSNLRIEFGYLKRYFFLNISVKKLEIV